MMSGEKGALSCGEVRALLAAFMSDAIPADESLRVQEHLDACPPCGAFRRFEDAFDAALRRGLRREVAPASLVLGVHDAIAREEAGLRGRLSALLAPGWPRWAAAAAAVIALLAPSAYVFLRGTVPAPHPLAASEERVMRGMLVCSGCELNSVPASSQRGCRWFGHHAAFKGEETGLWNLLETDAARPLLTDADRYGDEIEIRGVFLDDLKYVRVTSYRYLAAGRGADQGMQGVPPGTSSGERAALAGPRPSTL